MTWEELYPIIKTQAKFAVLRYEEPERRKDKIQELICQSFEKYQRDLYAGREIKMQDYKCFVTQRAKEVDTRSFVKGGGGGTSTMDPLGFFRRRPDSPTSVIQFDDWMTGTVSNKQFVDCSMGFSIDYDSWIEKLSPIQRLVLDMLIQGYKASRIAEKIQMTITSVKKVISELKIQFKRYFQLDVQYA